MRRWIWVLAALVVGGSARGQAVPAAVLGTWKIVRILPTRNTACWDESRARTLLGTTLTFSPHRLLGKAGGTAIAETLTRTLTAEKFQEEYKVSLGALGIRAGSVQEFDLQHEDADFTGATTEVPGDVVLRAGPGRIVVGACGVFYSAVKR